jgi:hypothetical protein
LEKKVRDGVFKEGVHYFKQPHMRRRWKWSAIVQWLENDDELCAGGPTRIPLANMDEGRADR